MKVQKIHSTLIPLKSNNLCRLERKILNLHSITISTIKWMKRRTNIISFKEMQLIRLIIQYWNRMSSKHQSDRTLQDPKHIVLLHQIIWLQILINQLFIVKPLQYPEIEGQLIQITQPINILTTQNYRVERELKRDQQKQVPRYQ